MPTAATPSFLPLPRNLVRGGVDWRKTFLRRHLGDELRSTSEILALRDFGSPSKVSALKFFLIDPSGGRALRTRLAPRDFGYPLPNGK